jgi:hypothetical protein
LRNQLQDAQRREKALLSDALLQNQAYIDANIQIFVLQKRQQANRAEQNEHALTNEYTRALAVFSDRGKKIQPIQQRRNTIGQSISNGEQPYMQEHLGEFGEKVETAKVAWDNARYENAMKANPDKWKALKASTDTWDRSTAKRKLVVTLVGRVLGPDSVDDIKQLRFALKLQQPSQWLFTTDDWNTEHKLEEDLENKNEHVQRWMKRVKPYRYGDSPQK